MGVDEATEDAVLRKVSLRVVPLLGLAFFMSFLDRINIGILATPMEADLALTAEAFGFAVGIFYIGYLVLQVPSNVAMYKFGGRIWITRILVTWGFACAAIAFVQTPMQLYIARFVLGAAEAGLVPAILLLISQWYPKARRGQGYALFQLWEPFALAVGAVVTTTLLAAFTGVGPIAGWRWVFLIEGMATVVVGAIFWFAMPASPTSARFLDAEQRAYLERRLRAELVDPDEDTAGLSEGRKLVKAMTSWRAWYLAVTYFCIIVGFWTVTYYMPQIFAERFQVGPVAGGFLSAVPWILSFLVIVVVARWARRIGNLRWYFTIALLAAAAGFYVAASTENAWAALIGFSVSCAGIEAVFPMFFRAMSGMFFGIMAAVVMALVNSVGNVGGFLGPYIYGVLTTVTGGAELGLYVMGAVLTIAALLAAFIDRLDPQRADSTVVDGLRR